MDSKIRYGQLISALSDRPRQSKATLLLPFPDFWSPYSHQLRIRHLCPQFCYKNNKSFVRVKQNGYFLYCGGNAKHCWIYSIAHWETLKISSSYISVAYPQEEAPLCEKTRWDMLYKFEIILRKSMRHTILSIYCYETSAICNLYFSFSS